jgi:Secretion system C-terminal sorting domain
LGQNNFEIMKDISRTNRKDLNFVAVFFGLLLFLGSSVSFSQTTVTKTYTAPSSVTIDGCGTYCATLPGVTFSAADFAGGACQITDVNVSITWAKTDGTCFAPLTGNSFHNETSFRIDGPTGNNVILVQPNSYTGNGSTPTTTTILDQSAATVIGGTDPFSGTFQPNNGNLNTFNGTSAFGTWFLRAGDLGGGDPLCIVGYSVTITVAADNTPPVPDVASLPDISAVCSVTSLTAPTATDNCNGLVTGTHNATLPITTQGTTVVTWTYDDGNGNTSTQTQNVILDDIIAPVPDVASLADITSECAVTSLTAPTATDNCGGAVTVTNNATLPISTQGTTVVTWTYDDGNGNTATQTQNVILDDVTAPVPDVASLADVTAECTVTSLTAPTATDNCGGAVTATNNATLPIATQGTTVVTWTYDDGNGNTATQTQNVILDDVTAPVPDVATLADVTAQCTVTSLTAPTATDNCGGPVTVTNNATLPITMQGTTVVTWTYDDGNGNTSTQTQNVIVNDVTPPTAVCQNATIFLDAAGNATLSAAQIDNGSTDNCGMVSISASQTTFTCANVGPNSVTLSVTDGSGNVSTCVAIVTVVSNSPTGTDTQVSCGPYTWIDGNIYAASNNTATHTIVGGAANGCDSIVTLNLTIPVIGTPANVGSTNITEFAADITWDPMPLPAGGFFTIQYQEFPLGPWISAGTAPAGSTSISISGLNPATLYEVQVAGNCDAMNQGPWSSSAFFTTNALSCSSPIVMSVTSNLGNAITTAWPAIPASGWYEFRYKLTASSTWIFAGTLGGSATSKIFSGLAPSTSYDFEGRTFCPNGLVGPWSPTLTVVTNALSGCALPPTPVASVLTGNTATITWSVVAGAGWYEFRYKPAAALTWISGGTAGPSATSKYYAGLLPNTAYNFEARTYCVNGVVSGWQTINFTTTSLVGCELPPVLNSTAIATTSSIQIQWSAVSGAAWYSFQYKVSSSSVWINGGTAGSAVTAKLYNGLLSGTSYDFQIRTHCPTGIASAWSPTGTYSTNSIGSSLIGTTEKAENEEMDKALESNNFVTTVYPNPTSDKVNIEIFMETADDHSTIKLVDMSGRLVREVFVSTEKGINTFTFDIADVVNGMYTLFIYQNDELYYTTRIKKN